MVDAQHPASLVAGRVLSGRYRLAAPIARGGMAEVWRGVDEVLDRPVAVKVLLTALATDGAVRERFRREAVAAARLAHPNVVATFDTGIDDGLAFIVMELVQGPTLRDLMLERGPLPLGLALSVADQIADALAAAHRAGLVHRDIKPANVLVADDDGPTLRVKVTDFGIAKAAEEAGGADLTLTGTVIGTPKYLSPEQVQGHEPDPRADLYALGVVLFEMLAGRPPFEGPTQMATALAHLTETPPLLSTVRPGVPPELDELV
ncbi:MAG TPA: protein kinase, partial [Acidimicrobiales bacterium]|nr:protein kinase [Acidimicrobiales bacterium]